MKLGGVPTPVRLRRAKHDDCRVLAHLYRMSSCGLADYVWGRAGRPGESPLDTGERRYAESDGPYSHDKCLIAELDGEVVGMVHAYPVVGSSKMVRQTDPILRAFQILKDPGSLHIEGLAVVPFARCLGIGSFLLRAAGWWAGVHGLSRLSLVCLDRNVSAMALFNRAGLHEVSRCGLCLDSKTGDQIGEAVLLAGESLWGVPTSGLDLERTHSTVRLSATSTMSLPS